MTGWPGVVFWCATVYVTYRALKWLISATPDRTPPPRQLPAPPPPRCSDPPCEPEDNWICVYHAVLVVDRLCAAAERYANDQANHA